MNNSPNVNKTTSSVDFENGDGNKPAELTLLILPTEEVLKLDLLKKTNWRYVESITDVNTEVDINDSLQQIKEFYDK